MAEVREVELPDDFRCPISLDLMKDPVVLSTGITYDRQCIEAWLSQQSSSSNNIKCPVTNKILRTHSEELIPNHMLRRCIHHWCVQQANTASGSAERMPDSAQTIDTILAEVNACKLTGKKLKEAMQKLKAALAKECYTSRERIASTRLATSVFCGHCKGVIQKLKESVEVCEEALGTLVMVTPVDEETDQLISSSSEALLCITRILVEGSPQGKINAVLILEKLAAHADPLCWQKLRDTVGLAEGLVQFLRIDQPLGPTAAKAATISTIYYIAAEEIAREKLVESGAFALLLEILPRADRSVCETSLGAMDQLCNCAQGRSAAYDHALTVPLVSEKILRVSDLATEFAVSILWTLCRHSDSPSVALQAVQQGSFQRLLVLLQLGSNEKTRKKASQLLGLFNHYRYCESSEWERAKATDFWQVM